jgi:RecA-family ATPase
VKNCTIKLTKTPSRFADLNDWRRDSATARDLVDAMVKAEALRKPEQSWNDALAKSVVTSRELGQLHLTPRKKLLSDWFREGDLGFIFAFRGVGKTWLALAIAEALSTAGKLGDWKAHERVRVLYVDGEMPPDLMRDRAQGLEKDDEKQ